jgi:hypothetical protein
MSREKEKEPTEAQTKQEESAAEKAASKIVDNFHSLISKTIWGK